jgi:hypothetical protein
MSIGNDIWFSEILPLCEFRLILKLRCLNKKFYNKILKIISCTNDYNHEIIKHCSEQLLFKLVYSNDFNFKLIKCRKYVSQELINFVLRTSMDYFIIIYCVHNSVLNEKNLDIILSYNFLSIYDWYKIFQKQYITPKLLNKYFMHIPTKAYADIYFQNHLYTQLKNISKHNRRIRRHVPFDYFIIKNNIIISIIRILSVFLSYFNF